jgi:hypothetical protein
MAGFPRSRLRLGTGNPIDRITIGKQRAQPAFQAVHGKILSIGKQRAQQSSNKYYLLGIHRCGGQVGARRRSGERAGHRAHVPAALSALMRRAASIDSGGLHISSSRPRIKTDGRATDYPNSQAAEPIEIARACVSRAATGDAAGARCIHAPEMHRPMHRTCTGHPPFIVATISVSVTSRRRGQLTACRPEEVQQQAIAGGRRRRDQRAPASAWPRSETSIASSHQHGGGGNDTRSRGGRWSTQLQRAGRCGSTRTDAPLAAARRGPWHSGSELDQGPYWALCPCERDPRGPPPYLAVPIFEFRFGWKHYGGRGQT